MIFLILCLLNRRRDTIYVTPRLHCSQELEFYLNFKVLLSKHFLCRTVRTTQDVYTLLQRFQHLSAY